MRGLSSATAASVIRDTHIDHDERSVVIHDTGIDHNDRTVGHP